MTHIIYSFSCYAACKLIPDWKVKHLNALDSLQILWFGFLEGS